MNPFSLSGKKILVTGASSGIGRSIAVECSKMGANLIITGRNVPDPYYLDKKVKLVELFSYHKLGLTNKYTHLFGDS